MAAVRSLARNALAEPDSSSRPGAAARSRAACSARFRRDSAQVREQVQAREPLRKPGRVRRMALAREPVLVPRVALARERVWAALQAQPPEAARGPALVLCLVQALAAQWALALPAA